MVALFLKDLGVVCTFSDTMEQRFVHSKKRQLRHPQHPAIPWGASFTQDLQVVSM